jgi:hypothetical protein
MTHPLDNIFWHSLSGAHAHFAEGRGNARRYAKGFSPILGFAHAQQAHFSDIDDVCDVGEHFYVAGWTGAVPDGWQIEVESRMYRMVWDGDLPPDDPDFIVRNLNPSNANDANQALTLARLTNPGPFGLRTIELGEYLACFDADQLIAMAGERSFAPPYREVSGVCTSTQRRAI